MMKLKRVVIKETASLEGKSTEYKHGYFAGFVTGRDDQLKADQGKVEEQQDVID